MDNRYKETRGASDTRQRRSDALVRSSLEKARVRNRSLNSERAGYESGPKALASMPGAGVISARSQERADSDQLFQSEGSGVYGGEASAWELKKRDRRVGLEDPVGT